MVDKADLETVLRLFSANKLRDINYEKETGVKSRKKDELVQALVELDWTKEEFENLKNRYFKIQRSKSESYYLAKITSPTYSLEDIKESLLEEEAKFEDGDLVQGGYEVEIEDNVLEGKKWSLKIKRDLSPTGEVRKIRNVTPLSFKIDKDEDLLYIDTNMYFSAKGVKSDMEKRGLILKDIGHNELFKEDAKEMIENFVEDLKEELSER